MTATTRYSFRKIAQGDIARLNAWRLAPHVRQWWGEETGFDEGRLAEPGVNRWIVSCDGQPFAFMQDYTVHEWEDHHLAGLPDGARGIDQFIGDPAMVGIGHGTAFIGMRMQALFGAGTPVIGTDPHPDNARAIAAYRKLGFRPIGPAQETQWGLVLPMAATRG